MKKVKQDGHVVEALSSFRPGSQGLLEDLVFDLRRQAEMAEEQYM